MDPILPKEMKYNLHYDDVRGDNNRITALERFAEKKHKQNEKGSDLLILSSLLKLMQF